MPEHLEEKINEIGNVDIVVGILCKNVEATILHVINAVSEGLHKHFSEYEKMIVVSDGFSSDRTDNQIYQFGKNSVRIFLFTNLFN